MVYFSRGTKWAHKCRLLCGKKFSLLRYFVPKKEKQVSEIVLLSACLKVRLQFTLLKLLIVTNIGIYIMLPGRQPNIVPKISEGDMTTANHVL